MNYLSDLLALNIDIIATFIILGVIVSVVKYLFNPGIESKHYAKFEKIFNHAYNMLIFAIILSLIMSAINGKILPKHQLLTNKDDVVNSHIERINNNEKTNSVIVDITEKPKETDAERLEKFKETVKW